MLPVPYAKRLQANSALEMGTLNVKTTEAVPDIAEGVIPVHLWYEWQGWL